MSITAADEDGESFFWMGRKNKNDTTRLAHPVDNSILHNEFIILASGRVNWTVNILYFLDIVTIKRSNDEKPYHHRWKTWWKSFTLPLELVFYLFTKIEKCHCLFNMTIFIFLSFAEWERVPMSFLTVRVAHLYKEKWKLRHNTWQ